MRGTSITGGAIFLLALLIMAVYYVGVSTDAQALANALSTIGNTLTGRNAKGEFAAYPSGASMQGGRSPY